jgi:hypothetical protein
LLLVTEIGESGVTDNNGMLPAAETENMGVIHGRGGNFSFNPLMPNDL